MDRKDSEIPILTKYDKLFHHLHIEFPELSELSSKTLETFDVSKRKKLSLFRIFHDKLEKINKKESPATFRETTRNESRSFLCNYAKTCPSTQMSRFQIRDIKNLVKVPGLQEKYTDKLDQMFREIREDYLEVSHASGIHLKIKGAAETPGYFEIKPFKNVGKTERYGVYLWFKKELRTKWMLHQPLLKLVIRQFDTLPDILFSISRKNGVKMDLEDLEYEMQKSLIEARRCLEEFYGNIEAMAEKDTTNVVPALWESYLGSCSCAITIHLSKIIENTLNHVVEITSSQSMPLLNLYITFNSKMELVPTSGQLTELFHCLIKDTLALTKQFKVLQHIRLNNFRNKHIPMYLTDEFVTDLLKKVESNIETMYRSVIEYLKDLNGDIQEIYGEINHNTCVSDLKFEDGCERIKYFRSYYSKVSLIPEYELFDMGIVILSGYIFEIQKRLKAVINKLFGALASQSHWEIKDIQECFEIIKIRAAISPITTEQTIEIGKYMAWVKAEFIQEATERLGASLIRLASLLEVGILDDDHITLNISVVKELDKIEPLIDENLAMFEQLKFEAEEKLQKHIETVNELTREVHPILCLLDDMDDILKIRQYLCKINQHLLKIKYIETQIAWINDEEVSLSFPKSSYPEFEELKNYVYPFFHLMKLSLDVQRNVSVWLDGQFDLQSFDKTKAKTEGYQKELTEMQKNYRKKLRKAQDDNLQMRFKGTVDDPDILNWPAPLKICSKTLKLVEDFHPCISLMKIVCNPALRTRHWKEMSSIAQIDLLPNAGSTLRKLMTYDLKPFLDPLEIISQGASHEQGILEILIEMQKNWLEIKLTEDIYGKTDFVVFTNLKFIIEFCEENLEKLLIINRSGFVKPHRDVIDQFRNDLEKLKEILSFYGELQKKVFHLLPFFIFIENNEEIFDQLEEFDKIKNFKKSLYAKMRNKAVFDILKNDKILEDIQAHCALFETIYFGVKEYLNYLREKFYRFYFLSNEELIEMLSYSLSDEQILQHYFSKCFKCISELKLRDGKILGLKNSIGETIEFSSGVCVEKNLVDTFISVERNILKIMIEEVSKVVKDDFKNERILRYLGQAVYVVSQVLCSSSEHQAIHGDIDKLKEIVMLCEVYTKWTRQTNFMNSEKISLRNVLISLIHHKEFADQISLKKMNDKDFSWLSRLRYYIKDNKCSIQILNFTMNYGYEYFDNSTPGISTIYTDRCNTSILNAYFLKYSSAIHGKASSGKTETLKNLSISLGVNFLTIPCTKSFSYEILRRCLIGSLKGNMWICLDEINKVNFTVLSMLSDLMEDFRTNIKFVGNEIHSFVCVTLNPTFPKLTELPVTFKNRFRNIGLLPVDFSRLCEITLASIGYENARNISRYIGCLFNMMPHILLGGSYDFSVKVMKNILGVCDKNAQISYKDEENIVFDAVQEVIRPMLVSADEEAFEDLVKSIFGFSKYIRVNLDLKEKIISAVKSQHLTPFGNYIEKILQTKDAIISKQNLILLGDICSGKTNAIKILHHVMEDEKDSGLHIINPTIFDIHQLYGFMDYKYNLWTDGIITKTLREFSMEKFRGWMVFDGPIEPFWIEELYSVLEEARVVTLASGESLRMLPSNSILFEVTDLRYASPTLTSRCTVIYYEVSPKPWMVLIEPWIEKHYSSCPENLRQLLHDLLLWLIPPLLKFVNDNCVQECQIGDFCLVKKTVKYVQMLLNEALAKKDEDIKNITIWLQASVFLGIFNGLTSTLNQSSVLQFDAYFKQLSKNQIPEYPLPTSIERIDVNVPTEGLLSDFFYLYKGRGNFKYIPDTLKNEKVLPLTNIDDVLVPTTDTIRILTILSMHVSNNFPILLMGPTGSGKTMCINHYLNHVSDKSKSTQIYLKFMPRLTSRKLQSVILSSLRKNISFSETGVKRRNLIIIEDLNVVSLDECKVSRVVEFLRQTLDHEFWYDDINFEKISHDDLGFIATMNFKGGMNENISPRLLKHFNIFKTNDACEDNLLRIFSNLLLVAWKKNGFASDVAIITNSLANASLNIYKFCSTNFKTSPLNFSYCFNIFDFFKVLRGLFLLKKDAADANKKIHCKLWMHECLRVFGDRLLRTEEKGDLYRKLIETYEQQFKESFEEVFNGMKPEEIESKIIFGTITNSNSKYEEMEHQNIIETVSGILKKNYVNDIPKIVLFEEFLVQIIKITRILSIDNSSTLILGTSGTGRKTLTKLASFIHNCKMFDPHIFYNYNTKKWHEAFKNMLLETGGRGKKAVLYLSEEHLKHKFVIEDINFFLKNGEIIDLFDIEEEPMLLNMVRLDAQLGNPNLNISSESVYSFFVNRCKAKLHIILSFSCETIVLENRLKVFQSFVKYCTPIWFEKWSSTALMEVASYWIRETEITGEMRCLLPKTFVNIFYESKSLTERLFRDRGEQYHITTASYTEFLKLYVEVMSKEQRALNERMEKFLTGLRKLKYADDQITKLKQNLTAYKLQLNIMSKKAAEMTKQIARETIEVERASDLVKNDEQIANKQAEGAAVLKLDCEADLAQAIPILEDAIQALNTLKPSDITLVKSMKNPPDAIKLVMAAVCVIKDVKPDRIPDPSTGRKLIDYWGPSKRILGDMNFLQTLKDFDKDHIKAEIMVKVRKDYLPHKDFKPHVVAKASSAAEGLCKWIIAMDMYDKVAKEVAPKKEKLEKAEKEYAQTVAILEEKKLEVVRLEKQLAQLNCKLQEANKKQQKLQRTADACNRKLERSVILLSGFENEKSQWTEEVNSLQNKRNCLSGDVLLTCATISYLSTMPLNYRKEALEKWHRFLKDNNVLRSDNWDLTSTLLSNGTVFTQGLPKQNYFVENCIIHKYSYKFPLFIDPHGMVKNWVQKTFNSNLLHIINYGDPNFISEIQYCIKSGKCLLIENIGEEISSAFNSLMNKEITQENDETFIFFEAKILFNENFKLFLTTPLTYPNYKSEYSNKIRLINFTLTESAFQKKLLSLVIKTENPLVSKQMSIYQRKQQKNKILLKKYEDKILKTLSDAEVDILEDYKVLKILDHTKKLSEQTGQAVYIADNVVTIFEQLEKNFKEFSHHASILFFSIEEFTKVRGIVKLSTDWFMRSYRKSILAAPLSNSPQTRIDNVTNFLTYTISRLVQRTIFAKDALNFLFHMCCNILVFQGKIDRKEFEFLYEREQCNNHEMTIDALNKISEYSEAYEGKSLKREEILKKIGRLEELDAFHGLRKSFVENELIWDSFLSQNHPEKFHLPDSWQNKLNSFQKFILIQTLRADRTKECIKQFISDEMGEKYIQPLEIDFEVLYAESFCLSPLLFLTSNKGSPLNKIKNFATRKKFNNKFHSVCLAENDNLIAEKLIDEGKKKGLWICLLNCHLSKSWTLQLDNICGAMSYENTHENFRLWLVSDVSFKFSNELFERCVKVLYESPDCFKENLLVSYKDFVDDINVEGYQSYSQKITRLIYRVLCFHCVVEWRQKFKGIAWNIPYEFDDNDLKVALKLVPFIITTYDSHEALKYLIGDCCYSGQFLSEIDCKVSDTLFDEFIQLDGPSAFSFPAKNDFHDFVAHIMKLPSEESPTLLGFNDIIVYRKNIEESKLFSSYIASLGSRSNEGNEHYQVFEFVEKVMNLLNVEIHHNKHNDGNYNALETVLFREIKSYFRLVGHIKKHLENLLVAKTNNIPLSQDLQVIASDFYFNKIPVILLKYSYDTDENFSTYIWNLRRRLCFLKQWVEHGTPKSFWISSFFYPNSFLTAQKILYSRKIGIHLIKFSSAYEIINKSDNAEGFDIYGLYLVNGKFDKKTQYVELLPKNLYCVEVSCISIRPALKEEKSFCYACPVYRTDKRIDRFLYQRKFENLLFSIYFQTNVPESTLIKLGVAFVCESPKHL